MNDGALVRHLAAAIEDLDRLQSVMPTRLSSVADALNAWPAGHGFDGDGRGGTVTFCEVHERDHCECGGGTTYAVPTDRTGDAGVAAALGHDRAAADRAAMERLVRSIRRQANDLVLLARRYESRAATDEERRRTLEADQRDAACTSCSRTHVAKGVARWEPAHKDRLCRWCYDWRRSVGRLPTMSELEQHHRGLRMTRPA